MTMTDEELDREWKPSGRRPQSTIAQMFSQELMDIFRIENSVTDLDEKVDKRKQQINTQASELEALEARIREMERRLKGQNSPDNPTAQGHAQASSAQPADSSNTSDAPPPPPEKDHPSQKYAGSRPGTARQPGQPAVPGALPPTPAGSEGESEPSSSPPFPTRAVVPPRWPPPSSSRTSARPTAPPAAPPRAGAGAGRSRMTSAAAAQGDDSDSVASSSAVSESASFADYVIVPEPDGDREREA